MAGIGYLAGIIFDFRSGSLSSKSMNNNLQREWTKKDSAISQNKKKELERFHPLNWTNPRIIEQAEGQCKDWPMVLKNNMSDPSINAKVLLHKPSAKELMLFQLDLHCFAAFSKQFGPTSVIWALLSLVGACMKEVSRFA